LQASFTFVHGRSIGNGEMLQTLAVTCDHRRAPLNCMKAAGCPSTALALREQCRRAGRAPGMAGLVPRPNVCHMCRFSGACDETQPYSGAAVWRPTGKEPADVEHPKVREILWGIGWDMASHGRRGVSYQQSSSEGTLCSRTQRFRSSSIVMALSRAMQLTSGACNDGVFQLRT
jgi:hypothetical protein